MTSLPPMLRFVSPAELAERLAAERRGTPFLLYLDNERPAADRRARRRGR